MDKVWEGKGMEWGNCVLTDLVGEFGLREGISVIMCRKQIVFAGLIKME